MPPGSRHRQDGGVEDRIEDQPHFTEPVAGVLGLADHGSVLLEVFFNIVEDSELFVEADEQVFMVVELICHELVFVF